MLKKKTNSNSNPKNKVLSLQQLRQVRGGGMTELDNPNAWSTLSGGCPDNQEWSTLSSSC
jgi:hypothetical protein